MIKETNTLFALVPFLVMFAGYMWNYNRTLVAKVWTVEDCVTEKYHSWYSSRAVIPSVEQESEFRDECWEQMGASLN